MEEKITIYDIIAKVVQDSLISLKQEDQLKEMLNRRAEERKMRTLLGILENELKSGKFRQATVKKYKPIVKRCFSGTYGTMDISQLNQEMLQAFITEIYESGMSRTEICIFLSLLKKALGKAGGILKFTPSPNLFINHAEMSIGTKLIRIPYVGDTQKAITDWIMEHLSDTRALACALWLVGGDGLSPDKIIDLKGRDAWKYCPDGLDKKEAANDIVDFDSDVKRAGAREKIITLALRLHPEDTSYVFMVQKKENSGWTKLSGPSLQAKMSWICADLGLQYIPFHNNEAITFH